MFRSQLTLTLRGVVLVATLMLSQQGVALAEQNPYSANYVMPGCRAFMKGVSLNSFKQGWCGGLITGLAQMYRRCMPPELTQRQLARGIVQYIDARPARMREDFRNLAVEAMQAAWPCNRYRYRGLTVSGPRIRQLAPLLQRVTPPIDLFGLVNKSLAVHFPTVTAH